MESFVDGDFLVFHDPTDDTMHVQQQNQLSYDSILSWLESDDQHPDAAYGRPQPDLLMLDYCDDVGLFIPLPFETPTTAVPPVSGPPPESSSICHGGLYGGDDDFSSLFSGILDFEIPATTGPCSDEVQPPDQQLQGVVVDADAAAAADMFFDDEEAYLITPAGSPESGFQCHLFSPPSPASVEEETARGRKRKHKGRSSTRRNNISSMAPRQYMMRSKRTRRSSGAEYEEEEDDMMDVGLLNCKNLMSERNRRKRLSQQLLALRSMVPNITKMDKRSVLVDALSYLREIHEKTARIQAEIKEQAEIRGADKAARLGCGRQVVTSAPPAGLNQLAHCAQFLEVDVERMEERRFVLKITSRSGGIAVGAKLLRVVESLGFDITFASLEHIGTECALTTAFVRVRKHMKMTEAKLKEHIATATSRMGMTLIQDNFI